MTARAGPGHFAPRRSTKCRYAIWGLWTIAVVCASLWAQGLVHALTPGAGEQAGVLLPTSWDTLAGALRTQPFLAVPLLLGPARAHRLQSWAFAAFPLGLIAEGAVVLSLYLRKKPW